MSNPWFRFYSAAIRHPKVARLPDSDFRLWVKLLAVACENNGFIPPLTDLKHVLNTRLDYLLTGVERLISALLVDRLEVGYTPHNWNKKQFISDTSTPRVTLHRKKQAVSETPPDTEQNRTEQIARKEEPKKVLLKEKRGTRLPNDFEPDESCHQLAEKLLISPKEGQGILDNFLDYWKGVAGAKGVKLDWQATFRNQLRHFAKTRKSTNGQFTKPQTIGDKWRDGIAAAKTFTTGESLSGDQGISGIQPLERIYEAD